MAEIEGPTCTTCFTLNPPGAPACIRCNSPLPVTPAPAASPTDIPGMRPAGPGQPGPLTVQPAPGSGPGQPPAAPTDVPGMRPAGSGQLPGSGQPAPGGTLPPRPAAAPGRPPTGPADPRSAPGASQAAALPVQPAGYGTGAEAPEPVAPRKGLAAPPRGTPGGSRAAAAAVQPVGFGMGTDTQAPVSTGPSPAEVRRIRRRITVVGSLVVLLVLGGGGAALWLTRPRYLDVAAIADRIGAELTTRYKERVTVRCPGTARQRSGETFQCTATNDQGIRLVVQVTVLDSAGRYRWTALA